LSASPLLVLHRPPSPLVLHSFPTRRSSDLNRRILAVPIAQENKRSSLGHCLVGRRLETYALSWTPFARLGRRGKKSIQRKPSESRKATFARSFGGRSSPRFSPSCASRAGSRQRTPLCQSHRGPPATARCGPRFSHAP